jgi:ectoine hydroxylase-related dioxygenase (phytanoyl-CoA dioxygenase family)
VNISHKQRRQWDEHGYLIVEGFFDDHDVRAVESLLQRVWRDRPGNVTVDDLVTSQRIRASQVSDADLNHLFKVNDLYLIDPGIRRVISSKRVVSLLGELLGDVPVVCNTLNMEKGSQQGCHLDTLYMTPVSDFALVATWMALEDVHPDAGPLRYFPGSQRIEPFRFSSGLFHYIPSEMPRWFEYMDESVARLGLEEERLLAKKGDLLIWDALLFHGGSPINDLSRTRNSLVTHFITKTDCEAARSRIRPIEGGAGMWLDRPQAPIPGESMSPVQQDLDERSEGERLVTAVRSGIPSADTDARLSATLDTLAETERRLRFAQHQLATIKGSRSWRITRPLRMVRALDKNSK